MTNAIKTPNAIRFLVLLFLLTCFPDVLYAGEFVEPTYPNLINMLIRYGAMDIRDNDVINSYAVIQECQLYHKFYRDDFKWHKIQAAMRESIRQHVETYPTGVRYVTKLQLGRYDFKNKMYRFTPKTSPQNVNLFTLDAGNSRSYCEDGDNNILPHSFKIVLDELLTLDGLPFGEEEGNTLLQRMNKNGNEDHIVYTIFNMRVTYIEVLKRQVDEKGRSSGPLTQGGSSDVRIDARLNSIEFYEDPEHTKLIYSYRP